MRLSFSPQRREGALTVHKQDDLLTINGEAFDFSELPNGGTLPAGSVDCEWIVGDVIRVNGEIGLTLLLPHGANPSPVVAFPEPMVDPADGDLAIPYDPEPEPQQEAPADEQD